MQTKVNTKNTHRLLIVQHLTENCGRLPQNTALGKNVENRKNKNKEFVQIVMFSLNLMPTQYATRYTAPVIRFVITPSKRSNRVGSRFATVRFTTIHFYDTFRVGPSTPDLRCVTVSTQASFLYSVRFQLFHPMCLCFFFFYFGAVLLS